jgi:hypothetical protein
LIFFSLLTFDTFLGELSHMKNTFYLKYFIVLLLLKSMLNTSKGTSQRNKIFVKLSEYQINVMYLKSVKEPKVRMEATRRITLYKPQK